MRCPVCQTPPRVVTHRIWVEKPNRTVSQIRSLRRTAPIRPSSHQHMPTPAAARSAFTPDSHWSAVTGPTSATSGINATAGKGANGT